MNNSLHGTHTGMKGLNHNWCWLLTWGILLFALGILAMAFSSFTSVISTIIIGLFILSSGIIILIDSFMSWWERWPGFFLHLIMGILYAAAGSILIKHPMVGSVSLTLLLGVFYIFLGAFRISSSISLRFPQWKWSLLSGVLALVLGILIIAELPESGLFIIGLFVGIDLVFVGWFYIMAALNARTYVKN